MARKRGWDDPTIGKRGGSSDSEIDLDDLDLGLADELEIDLDPSPPDDVNPDDFLDAPPKKPVKKAKKKATKKKTKKVAPAPQEPPSDEEDYGLGDDPPELPQSNTEQAAVELGIDLASECPVCRSLEDCDCDEEDRSFLRRVRFEDDVKKVARCPRCGSPLSVAYLPRPGTHPPYRLPQFSAIWGCACCQPVALATAILGTGRVRPHS